MWSEYFICRKQKVKKTIFEQLGDTYREESNYLIPCLIVPTEKEHLIVGSGVATYLIKFSFTNHKILIVAFYFFIKKPIMAPIPEPIAFPTIPPTKGMEEPIFSPISPSFFA